VWWEDLPEMDNLEDLPEMDNLEDLGVDGSSRSGMGAWTGLIWFRIGADIRLF